MADQPDHSGSAMLALYPDLDIAATFALPGGLPAQSLHVTIVYAGDAADVDSGALIAAAQALAARNAFAATVSGSARFIGGANDALVSIVDSPAIEDLRRDALEQCAERGIEVPREHGYVSHLTRRYLDPADPDPLGRTASTPINFTAISAVHGDTRVDFPFASTATETLAQLARSAFAAGWARTGAPMTPRVRAGCAAAMELATANPHGAIFEVTLKLGSLEGTWAKVYQRREQLIDKHARKANAAWKTLLTRDMIAGAVSAYRRRAGTLESGQSGKSQDAYAADAIAAANAMLMLLPARPEWKALRQAIYDALAAGQAEGVVDAVAIAAEHVGQTGLDWDFAFDHAIAALEDLDSLWADADDWLEKILNRATVDLGRALANATRAGATYPQMLSDAMAVLDSDDVDAVSFVVDWASTTALGQGALRLYREQGVTAIDWLTAGDDVVCESPCESNEENGPYAPDAFPSFPGHPRCRCTPSAKFSLASFAKWFTAA
jgi:2'-5' RNA ligase